MSSAYMGLLTMQTAPFSLLMRVCGSMISLNFKGRKRLLRVMDKERGETDIYGIAVIERKIMLLRLKHFFYNRARSYD
jgi:hypothetical protein